MNTQSCKSKYVVKFDDPYGQIVILLELLVQKFVRVPEPAVQKLNLLLSVHTDTIFMMLSYMKMGSQHCMLVNGCQIAPQTMQEVTDSEWGVLCSSDNKISIPERIKQQSWGEFEPVIGNIDICRMFIEAPHKDSIWADHRATEGSS